MSSPVLSRSLRRRAAVCGVLSLFAVLTADAVDPAPSYPWEEAIWRRAANLQVDEALAHLPDRRKAGSDAERRQLDYTRAVLLLNAQPKLQGNIDQARSLLESVRQTRADDATGLGALYYLARIAQFHADPADPAKAASLYADLIARAPDFPLAQEAVARLAALRLFDNTPPEERRKHLDEFEAAANRLTSAAARRDLHFVLAEALLALTDDREGILRHLLAAREAGIQRQQLLADTTVRIAVLARELGHRDAAIGYYKEFLAAFPRDGRAYLLTGQLKEMEAQAASTPATIPTSAPAAASPSEPDADRVIIEGSTIPMEPDLGPSATPSPVPTPSP